MQAHEWKITEGGAWEGVTIETLSCATCTTRAWGGGGKKRTPAPCHAPVEAAVQAHHGRAPASVGPTRRRHGLGVDVRETGRELHGLGPRVQAPGEMGEGGGGTHRRKGSRLIGAAAIEVRVWEVGERERRPAAVAARGVGPVPIHDARVRAGLVQASDPDLGLESCGGEEGKGRRAGGGAAVARCYWHGTVHKGTGGGGKEQSTGAHSPRRPYPRRTPAGSGRAS